MCRENTEVNIKMQTDFDRCGYTVVVYSFKAKESYLEKRTVKFQSIQEKVCFLVN